MDMDMDVDKDRDATHPVVITMKIITFLAKKSL